MPCTSLSPPLAALASVLKELSSSSESTMFVHYLISNSGFRIPDCRRAPPRSEGGISTRKPEGAACAQCKQKGEKSRARTQFLGFKDRRIERELGMFYTWIMMTKRPIKTGKQTGRQNGEWRSKNWHKQEFCLFVLLQAEIHSRVSHSFAYLRPPSTPRDAFYGRRSWNLFNWYENCCNINAMLPIGSKGTLFSSGTGP